MASRELGFFKFIANEECLDRIKIPPDWVKYNKGNLACAQIMLRDQYGNHWHVQTEKNYNDLFLGKGWKTFTKETHLKVGDFIVFCHDGPNVFDVVLCGPHMCEKEAIRENKVKNEKIGSSKAHDGESTRFGDFSKGQINEEMHCDLSKFILDLPECIRVEDPQGREWYTKLTTWTDGRLWYYGGWKDLSQANLLQPTDILVCEFVKGSEDNKHFIKVQILRA
ncbi:hypothetical protein M9H77_06105 [Catharanthus roseus]|uniref:Uncharacterized protein n=1 Tax=Catharanthus roseus TaxID=4058 RepID=A0ACC0BR48_CATRO|nr:hypothetical protein M9H77_06105 [Catharanthus roseus]